MKGKLMSGKDSYDRGRQSHDARGSKVWFWRRGLGTALASISSC
jgi:hypothetical protein